MQPWHPFMQRQQGRLPGCHLHPATNHPPLPAVTPLLHATAAPACPSAQPCDSSIQPRTFSRTHMAGLKALPNGQGGQGTGDKTLCLPTAAPTSMAHTTTAQASGNAPFTPSMWSSLAVHSLLFQKKKHLEELHTHLTAVFCCHIKVFSSSNSRLSRAPPVQARCIIHSCYDPSFSSRCFDSNIHIVFPRQL